MQRIFFPFLILILLLSACGGEVQPTESDRQATFTLVLNDIRSRPTEVAEFEPADPGDQLQMGGQAQSGEDSRARLDLEPEGTILRLGPNTLFTLLSLNADAENPSSRLKLLFGQIWIILTKGNLEVETTYGLGAVRGSYMSVAFDPQQGMTISCLEGHCSLANQAGTVELTNGQTSSIPAADQPPTPPQKMDATEIQQWQAASPEAQNLLNPATSAEPRLMEDGNPIPDKAQGLLNTQPLQFTLTNSCTDPGMGNLYGDWLWQFERLPDANGAGSVERLVIATGETANGELPPGQYVVTDWFPNGDQHGPYKMNSDGSHLQVQNCPGGPPPQPANNPPPNGNAPTPTP
jgi:hypothetical protein